MFHSIRKYAPMVLIFLISLFLVAILTDEYYDNGCIKVGLLIENSMEFETDVDELEEADCCAFQLSNTNQLVSTSFSLEVTLCEESSPILSHKQKLGLVRRYGPKSDALKYNYTRTIALSGMNSFEFVPFFM